MAQNITLEDLICQVRTSRRLGPFAGVLSFFPKYIKLEPDGRTHRRIERMVLAMTPEERRNPKLVGDGERVAEIAGSSGELEDDVRKFLRQFDKMQDFGA